MIFITSKVVAFLLKGILGIIVFILWGLLKAASYVIATLLKIGWDLNSVFPFDYKLFYIGLNKVAICFLILLIGIDIIKGMSGIEDKEISILDYGKKILMAFLLMVFLPFTISVFTTICIFITKFFTIVFEQYNISGLDQFWNELDLIMGSLNASLGDVATLSIDIVATLLITILFIVIFIVAVFLIGFSIMKRYVELLIAVLFIPFIAISVYKDFDKLNVWLSKVAQIYAGQLINVFLLYTIMLISLLIINLEPAGMLVSIFLILACVSVAMAGVKTIQDYIMSTGTGRNMSPSSLYYGARALKGIIKK